MLKKIIVLLSLLGSAVGASAFTYEAHNGNVPFDHRFHRQKFSCKECHNGQPSHMEFQRESAHTFCIGCHKRKGAGPIEHCAGCHKVS